MGHQWFPPVPMMANQEASLVRMCGTCGFTQVLGQTGWLTIEGSVIGVSCTDQPAITPKELGYIPPTQTTGG